MSAHLTALIALVATSSQGLARLPTECVPLLERTCEPGVEADLCTAMVALGAVECAWRLSEARARSAEQINALCTREALTRAIPVCLPCEEPGPPSSGALVELGFWGALLAVLGVGSAGALGGLAGGLSVCGRIDP